MAMWAQQNQSTVCMYGHDLEYSMDQPVSVCQSCSWPAKQKSNVCLSAFAPENLVSPRDGFGRPVPRPACSFSILRLNLVLTHGIPPDFRRGVHFFIPPTATESVPSLSGHAIAYRWRVLHKVRRRRTSSPQRSSSNECCLFSCPPMDQLMRMCVCVYVCVCVCVYLLNCT